VVGRTVTFTAGWVPLEVGGTGTITQSWGGGITAHRNCSVIGLFFGKAIVVMGAGYRNTVGAVSFVTCVADTSVDRIHLIRSDVFAVLVGLAIGTSRQAFVCTSRTILSSVRTMDGSRNGFSRCYCSEIGYQGMKETTVDCIRIL